MLCQLSYAARSVRVCDILELHESSSLDINVISIIMAFFVLVLCTPEGEYDICDVTLSVYSIHTYGKLEEYAKPLWPRPGIIFKLARCGYTRRVTSQIS
jgi:hypothetical protein